MVQINPHFKKLKREYVFSVIERKLAELKSSLPHAQIVNLSIGDVALPLAPSVAQAISNAAQEMTHEVRGYGPSEGYLFLRKAISEVAYPKGLIDPEEVFVSDGTGCDATHIQELLGARARIGIPDPTYPSYLDSAIMGGRSSQITLLPCLESNRFLPVTPAQHLDAIYLCTPNNPTGVAMNRSELQAWVDYAHRENALLIVDNAYEAFVTSADVPHSIYEIEGAKEVAIELRSFSKTAGFTALRCAYAIIPKAIMKGTLHQLWMKRQAIKFNGVSYIIQRGAEASLSPQGVLETKAQIQHYLAQGKLLREGLQKLGFAVFGGVDAPYLWWKVPNGQTAWDYFDTLLNTCHLISIPGTGFGKNGEGYIRLSTFTTQADLALERLCALK